MAMNKMEQKLVEDLKMESLMRASLSWPQSPPPAPVEREDFAKIFEKAHKNQYGYLIGWSFNDYTARVVAIASNGVHHHYDYNGGKVSSWSQGVSCSNFHLTERDASLALLYMMTMKHAKQLALLRLQYGVMPPSCNGRG